MLYVLNLGEEEATRLHETRGGVSRRPARRTCAYSGRAVCGKVEAELAELPREEQSDYLASYGLTQAAWRRLITATLRAAGIDELPHSRAKMNAARGPFPMGSTAPKAAGAIHSDFEKKFHPRRSGKLEDSHRVGRLLRRAR